MKTLLPNEYKCAMCGGVFIKGKTDEEAEKEAKEYWSEIPVEEMDLVCDDCWKEINPDEHPIELAISNLII